MDADKVAEYIAKKLEIKDLKSKTKKLEDEAAEIEAELLPQFKESGMDRMTIQGRTVWLDRKVWASAGGDMPRLVDAMKAAGLEDMVGETVNGNTLSSWVREFDPEGTMSPEEIVGKLPPEVKDAITVSEVFKLQVRSS